MQPDFDRISEIFDRTRNRDPRVLKGVATGMLSFLGRGARVLDIGVGTGRFLLPMMREGIDGYGLDISMGMLQRARSKGLPNLVRGDGACLPFRDTCFDAVVMIDFLHLIVDWKQVLGEASRVSRKAVISIDRGECEGDPFDLFKSIMRNRGLDIPQPGPRERELASVCTPETRLNLGEYEETLDAHELIAAFEGRSFTFQSDLEEELNRECVEELRGALPSGRFSLHRNIELVAWKPSSLREFIDMTTFS